MSLGVKQNPGQRVNHNTFLVGRFRLCIVITFPKTNSSLLKNGGWETFPVLGRTIFWGYVLLWGGYKVGWDPVHINHILGFDSSSEIAWFECCEKNILEKNMAPKNGLSQKDISSSNH